MPLNDESWSERQQDPVVLVRIAARRSWLPAPPCAEWEQLTTLSPGWKDEKEESYHFDDELHPFRAAGHHGGGDRGGG